MGFYASTATWAQRSTGPGFHTRFVPPPGFPTLLTVFSLHAFRPRGPVPLMRFTLQSLSPPQSRTPFSAVALLPFLASRAPALRTRSSRCPAAPGLCSLRRSVPAEAEAAAGRCSHGFPSPLQSVPRRPRRRLPGTFPPALPSPDLGEIGRAALQGFDAPTGRMAPRGAARLS
jgi:hypothetical protein